MEPLLRGIDIGIYTLPEILAEKLEQRDAPTGRHGAKRRAEGTWNMGRWPQKLGKGTTPDRLFFACQGTWRGYFHIVPEVLFNPQDEDKPYSLIFDLTSWKEIDPTPAPRFRGFRYLTGMPT